MPLNEDSKTFSPQFLWPNLAANNFVKYLLLFKNFTTKFNKLATNRQFWHLEISPLFIYIFAAKKEKQCTVAWTNFNLIFKKGKLRFRDFVYNCQALAPNP